MRDVRTRSQIGLQLLIKVKEGELLEEKTTTWRYPTLEEFELRVASKDMVRGPTTTYTFKD